MRPPFLILETGQPVGPMRRRGNFGHWIRVAAGLTAEDAVVCRVSDGEALPRRDGFAGVIISGSASMVTERHDWSERSAEWLARAARHHVPLFGICYGHQLIAHAMGGTVDWNPRGREMGTVPVELHPEAEHDPLFAGLPNSFHAQLTHKQSVTVPPPGATILARSALDPCQAFRIGESSWGVQFHPEFSAGLMRGYIRARRDVLAEEGHSPRHMHDAVRAAPRAREVLRRFVRRARRHR
jgi:GMP synthase (glutamine-hydrolysing)